MLPICPSQTSTPTVITNQSDNLSSTGDNANLDEHTLRLRDSDQGGESVSDRYILYAPTSEYRLIDMFSGSNLNRINIQVFWKDQFGNLNPFLSHRGARHT